MFKKKTFLAVIPARGGSKGLPRKNIRLLAGKPLVVYSIEAALSVPEIDRTVVTSEDDEILAISDKAGAGTVLRPKGLAGDRARTEDALIDALDQLETRGETYDFVVTLEPTHPFRRPETVSRAIHLSVVGRNDSVLTLTEDRTDFWRHRAGRYSRLFPKAPRRRQDREPLFKENSLVYVTSVATLRRRRFVLGAKPAVLVTGERESLDIHTAGDLALAEALLASGAAS